MNKQLSRREFLILVTATTVGIPLTVLSEQRTHSDETPETLKDPWLTLAALQQHLFPAENDAPGASDIGALNYLRQMLAAPDTDKDDADFIIKGVGWLNDLSSSTYQQVFYKLDADLKEKILRKIEQSTAGERWLSLQLGYLIEALLSDPVYGGNARGQGWQWLEHQPGFPQPPADKRYFKLPARSHKGFKA